jgi:hypothetical protein
MKKVVIAAAVFAGAIAALRRFGPALGRRAMKKCEDMVEHMPEGFLPKRLMRGLEEIREQNKRILHELEEVRVRPNLAVAK